MVSNEVALLHYRTKVNVFEYLYFWSRLFSNFTAFQRLYFLTSLRIVKRTVTPYNVYGVLWDTGAVSDS